jgi:hypothetical protein
VGGGIPVDSNVFLVTEFVNLKIKVSSFFNCAHGGRIYVHMLIGVSAHMCISNCVYKKRFLLPRSC